MKKKSFRDNYTPIDLKQIFRVMKLSFVLSVLFVSSVFASGITAQNQKVTIAKKQMTTISLLNKIEQQTDYLFVYKKDEIDLNQKVYTKADNISVAQVLNAAFKNTDITYSMEGKNIMLMKNPSITPNTVNQDNVVKGIILDEMGIPVIGASIKVVGTLNGTTSDANGKFEISTSSNSKLEISFIGYSTQIINVDNKNNLSITLLEDTQILSEVVVIGYGTVKRSDLTGSLSEISNKSFKEQPVTRVDQVLQGRASGVQVTNTIGAPGGDVRIRIRGTNSVLGDNSPLFVIDGFVGADFNLIDPNDIESMQVLKDASSTAIYGSRGANGVILITTRQGQKDGKVRVNYSGEVSVANLIKDYSMLNAGEFAETVNAHDDAMGIASHTFTDAQVASYYENGGFDYLDAIFRTAISTKHQLSVSGGTPKTQYRISGTLLNQQGIIEESGYDRYTVRANIKTQANDKLSFNFNINGAYSKGSNNQATTGAGNALVQALSWAPTTNPYDDNGAYLLSDPVGSIKSNPLAIIYDSDNIEENIVANLMGRINYKIIDGLTASFTGAADLNLYQVKTSSGNYASNYSPSADKSIDKSVTFQTTSQLSYDKIFNDIHHINATAVFESQEYKWDNLYGGSSGLLFPELKYDNLAMASSSNVSSDFSKWTLLSYLARFNYTLMDKYLFSVSVRRDGSSKFAKENRYSTFPSAAIAWNAGNEKFIKDLNIFSKLKLRTSWGLTGSQAISPYSTLSAYNTSIYYAFSTWGKTNGIQMSNPGNLDLKWETTEQKDIGLEMGFFDGRLNIEVDYYNKETRDLLLNKSVPYYLGGGSITANVGNITNKGWDISISGNIISNEDINWESSLNFSTVKNRVTSLGDETRIFSHPDIAGLNGQPEFVYEEGYALGTFWGLKYLGPWQADEAAEAAQYGCVPGDARYEDLDDNYSIDGSDYQIIGNGMPKQTLGWNNTIRYKNFTLNAFVQGVFGNDKINYTRCINMMASRDARQATLSEITERYIPGVQENTVLPSWSTTSKWEPQSTLFMEDASFIRLKNLSLSYDFMFDKFNLKVIMSASNLFTITDYKGIDPESSNVGGGGSDIQQGIDYGAYPNSKQYTLGVQISF